MFLGFANFYESFIQSFSKIAALLILMLKSTLNISAGRLFKAADNSIFLISKAKLVFSWLRQIMIKKSIICYFNLKRFIYIKTAAFNYDIDGIIS